MSLIRPRPIVVAALVLALGAPPKPALASGPPVAALAAAVLAAQVLDTVQAADTLPADSIAGVPVVVRGDTLFRVFGRLGPFSPAERAAAIQNRLRLLVRTPAFVRDSALLAEQEGVVEIRAGESILMSITAADAEATGLTPREAGELYLASLQGAMTAERLALDVRQALVGLALTLLASAALAGVLWLLGRTFPVVYRWLRLQGSRMPSVRIQRLELLSSQRLARGLVAVARGARIALTATAIFVYLPLVFSFFPATRGLSDQLLGMLLTPIAVVASAIVAYIPSLLSILVIAAFTYYGLRLVRLVFMGLDTGTLAFPGFYQDWALPTYRIVRFLVVAFALVMVWPYLPRSDSAAFRGVAAFLGLLVTFGAASAISNVVGGVVMIYMRPFDVGDRVRISDAVGDVIEKGLLVTRIRTVKEVEITIPNAMVLASHIINYSAAATDGGVILHTSVTLGYDVPWRDVHDVMTTAAREVDGLLDDPPPFVLQTALGDYSVTYELNAYTHDPNRMAVLYSRLHEKLQDRFNAAGIEILSPLYAAVRDGNISTIPEDQRPAGYRAPAFRLSADDPGADGGRGG